MEFSNRVAVITGCGSTKGFGRTVALMLAEKGCTIVAADINGAGAIKTAKMIEDLGGKAIGVAANVADLESIQSLMKAAIGAFGRIDILINNAGISQQKSTLDMTPEEWNRMLAINLNGVFFCMQAALPYMIEQKYGRIVNVSSISAKNGGGVFGGPHYIAAKAAVIGITRAIGKEMAPYGITANCVAPGPSNTDLVATDFTPLAQNIPAGRIAKPADIAAAMTFLASEAAGYITGVTINVNGGAYMG